MPAKPFDRPPAERIAYYRDKAAEEESHRDISRSFGNERMARWYDRNAESFGHQAECIEINLRGGK